MSFGSVWVSVPASTLEWAHRFSGKGWWLAQPPSPSPKRCFSGKLTEGPFLCFFLLFCCLFFLLFCCFPFVHCIFQFHLFCIVSPFFSRCKHPRTSAIRQHNCRNMMKYGFGHASNLSCHNESNPTKFWKIASAVTAAHRWQFGLVVAHVQRPPKPENRCAPNLFERGRPTEILKASVLQSFNLQFHTS